MYTYTYMYIYTYIHTCTYIYMYVYSTWCIASLRLLIVLPVSSLTNVLFPYACSHFRPASEQEVLIRKLLEDVHRLCNQELKE